MRGFVQNKGSLTIALSKSRTKGRKIDLNPWKGIQRDGDRDKKCSGRVGTIDAERDVSSSYISYELINYTDKGKVVRDVPSARICMTFRAGGPRLCAKEGRIELQRQPADGLERRLKN